MSMDMSVAKDKQSRACRYSFVPKESSVKKLTPKIKPMIWDFLCRVITGTLDGLILIAVLPFVLQDWLSTHKRFVLVLKTVVAVILELIMCLIFGGVSILMAATFALDERSDKDDNSASSKELGNGFGRSAAGDIITLPSNYPKFHA